MKSILILNQKGGCGKTLIADEMCFCLERDKIPFNFYDLDQQGSAMHEGVKDKKANVQVIDTPACLSNDCSKWIENADMIIVPTKMTPRDMNPLIRVLDILKPYQKEKHIIVVFNGWNRFKGCKEFSDWFKKEYPEVRSYVLQQSELFTHANISNCSVYDIKKSSEVTQQILAIYSVCKYALNIRT